MSNGNSTTAENAERLPFNPNLHGLRGTAALAVLLFHWGSGIGFFPQARQQMKLITADENWDFGILIDFGWLGVPLFFVLSGYLLTSQLILRKLDGWRLRHFWLRRALRIYPAYWLQLAILLVLGSFFAFMPQLNNFENLLRHVFLWINLPPYMTGPMNEVWWTLPIELSFYITLPVLLWIVRGIGWQNIVLAALAITVGWRFGVMHAFEGENYAARLAILDAIPGTLFTFCVGFGIAWFLRDRPLPATRTRWALLLTSVGCFYLLLWWIRLNLSTYWTGHWMLGVWNPLMAVVIGTMMFSVIGPLPGIGWLGSRPMVWLGEVSYGIYLWHYPLLIFLSQGWLSNWTSLQNSLAALAITLIGTLLLAAVSYYFVERPIMSRRFL